METVKDYEHDTLTKEVVERLFKLLNKELCRKYRGLPMWFKEELYVAGGVCIMLMLGSRDSTFDIDAVWKTGDSMRECIEKVGDANGIGHNWCNSDFRKTKSYTDAIFTNSAVYKEYKRLVIRLVKPELMLAMKLVAFCEHKQTDKDDCIALIEKLKSEGISIDSEYMLGLIRKYYGSTDILSSNAVEYITRVKQ